jgi:hypothetical protein
VRPIPKQPRRHGQSQRPDWPSWITAGTAVARALWEILAYWTDSDNNGGFR